MATQERDGEHERGKEPDPESGRDREGERTDDGLATLVRLSYPADLGTHGERRITSDYYRSYLRRVKERASPGDEWDEFTDVGCCGSQMDVPLRVEGVEGGSRIGETTTIEYTERAACGINTGWSAQHDEPEPETGPEPATRDR